MRSRRSIMAVLICSVALVGVSFVVGQEQSPPNRKDGLVAEGSQLLNELRELRKTVGGNVLSGTLLEPSPDQAEAEFDAGLKKVIGLGNPAPSAENRNLATVTKASRELTNAQIVSLLRNHSSVLDRISNEIEHLRRYHDADQLRQTATELRLLARQLDVDADRCPSPSAK